MFGFEGMGSVYFLQDLHMSRFVPAFFAVKKCRLFLLMQACGIFCKENFEKKRNFYR